MNFNILFDLILYPILYILPAYVGNGAPVLFGGGKPLDNKRSFRGRRIFGNNKTIKGTIFVMIGAIAVGMIEYPFVHYMLLISIVLGIGTLVGDLLGSFIKRQLRFQPGRSFPIMDQYGFFVVALLFALPFGHTPAPYGIIFLFILTGILHFSTNIGAYMLKLKRVPW